MTDKCASAFSLTLIWCNQFSRLYYYIKMFRFHFLHKQQQGSSSQLGREAFDLLSVCSSLQAWMFSAAPPPSSFTRGRGPISVTITTTTTLSPFLSHPPTHRPLASFPFPSWHWADLRPEGFKGGIVVREDPSKLEGGRKHERK